MGNTLSVYTASQRSEMVENLLRSIHHHGCAVVLDVPNLIFRLEEHFRAGATTAIIPPPSLLQTPAHLEFGDFQFWIALIRCMDKSRVPGLNIQSIESMHRAECGDSCCQRNILASREIFSSSSKRFANAISDGVVGKYDGIPLISFSGLAGALASFDVRKEMNYGTKRNRDAAFEGDVTGNFECSSLPPKKRIILEECRSSTETPSTMREENVVQDISRNLENADKFSEVQAPVKRKTNIMSLHWDIIRTILLLLPRMEWRGFALTCKRFRSETTAMVLRDERVTSLERSDPSTWNLFFFTSSSFSILNRHWRHGPLFHPVNRMTFTLPYDVGERRCCSEILLGFLRSLAPGVQYAKDVFVNLGSIWDLGKTSSGMDSTILLSLLDEIHRLGCEKLSISSLDILGQGIREEPGPDILSRVKDGGMNLKNLTVGTVAFSWPTLTSWFMKQLVGNANIRHLKLSDTGFAASQLDSILCYFDLPQLESLVIGDAWLASVVEVLRGCPSLHSIQFLALSSDLRVPDNLYASLPALRYIRGDATTLSHFLPLLVDVSWDSFWEIDIDTNKCKGPEDSVLHTLDVRACIEVLKHLALNEAELDNLALAFPSLANLSVPLFEDPDACNVAQSCKVNRLRIQLHCDFEQENGELLEAMVPWLSKFNAMRSVFMYSVTSRVSALDKFSFKSSLNALRPDVKVKVQA